MFKGDRLEEINEYLEKGWEVNQIAAVRNNIDSLSTHTYAYIVIKKTRKRQIKLHYSNNTCFKQGALPERLFFVCFIMYLIECGKRP